MPPPRSNNERFPPDRGKDKNSTPRKPKNNASARKHNLYGDLSFRPYLNQERTSPSKARLPKGELLGLDSRQIGKIKSTLDPSSSNSKRKELSPTEKKALYKVQRVPQITQISDHSSMDDLQFTEEELKDMWHTLAPDQKRMKKFDHLRRKFESENYQGEQRPQARPTKNISSVKTTTWDQNKVSPSENKPEITQKKREHISENSRQRWNFHHS